MIRSHVLAAVGVIALAALMSACSPSEPATPAPLPTTRASVAPSASQGDLDSDQYIVRCWHNDSPVVEFESLEDVWSSPEHFENCDGNIPATRNEVQEAAFRAAGFTDDRPNFLGFIVGVCGELNGPALTTPIPDIVGELRYTIYGAVILCPEAPHAARLQEIVNTIHAEEARDATAIGNGVHVVHTDIAPGTYVSEGDITDCYWARLDNTGQVIENSFIPAATRIEVTVAADDYSLMINSCGMMHPTG